MQFISKGERTALKYGVVSFHGQGSFICRRIIPTVWGGGGGRAEISQNWATAHFLAFGDWPQNCQCTFGCVIWHGVVTSFISVQLLFLGTFQVRVINLTTCFPFPFVLPGLRNSNINGFGHKTHLLAHWIAFNLAFAAISPSGRHFAIFLSLMAPASAIINTLPATLGPEPQWSQWELFFKFFFFWLPLYLLIILKVKENDRSQSRKIIFLWLDL